MSNDPRLDYQSLLASAYDEAQDEYEIDPRMVQYAMRNAGENEVDVYQQGSRVQATLLEEASNQISIIPETEIDSLAVPVQNQPNMVEQKQVVIVDTAQRDWVQQPNAYSNIFGFGQQIPLISQSIQVPVYSNNQMIPYIAWEMPAFNPGAQANDIPDQVPNNRPRVVPDSVPAWNTQTGRFVSNNVYGWSLVIDKATGKYVHTPTVPNPALHNIIYFPPYDPLIGKGSIIATDSNILSKVSTGNTFSTQLELSNITKLRLIRASLPLRKFDSFDPNMFQDLTTVPNQSFNAFTMNFLNTFHTEPYMLMSIENLKGQYYGAGQVVQNAFAVLAQHQRTPLDANTTAFTAQFNDFYPWSDEAFQFDPPLAQLSNAELSISNSYGEQYVHLDDRNIYAIRFGLNPDPPNSNLNPFIEDRLGVITLFLYQGDPSTNSGELHDPRQYFSVNDFRPGDQLVVYQPTIDRIVNDPSCKPIYRTFLSNLVTHNLMVTNVQQAPALGFPTAVVGFAVNAVMKTANLGTLQRVVRNLSEVGHDVPNYTGTYFGVSVELGHFMTFATLTTSSSWQLSNTFSEPYPLPVMNRHVQAVYALEVTTLVPDSGQLGKIIPN